MTRKDFEIIAEILALIEVHRQLGGSVETLRYKIDETLKSQNPRYNSQKFWNTVFFNTQNEIDRYREDN